MCLINSIVSLWWLLKRERVGSQGQLTENAINFLFPSSPACTVNTFANFLQHLSFDLMSDLYSIDICVLLATGI